jgi:O-antigen/teichoic acid export membrane protein
MPAGWSDDSAADQSFGWRSMINPYAVIYLAAYMVPAAVGFLALIIYTHLLSPAEYGLYVVGVSIAGIVSALFFTWVRLSVSRYQARSPDLDLRGEAAVAYGGTVAVIAAVTPVAMVMIRPDIGFGFVAASLFLSLCSTAFEIGQEFKRARFNPVRFMTIAMIRSVAGLTLGYVAIRLGTGGLGLLVAVGLSYLAVNVLNLRSSAAKPLLVFKIENLAQFLRYGLPFTLGAVAFALHAALDRLGVAYLLGESGAGYYGLAADLTRQLVAVLAASVASAMFPIAFRSFAEKGAAATRERLSEGLEILLALIAPVVVWLALSADVVAGALLGREFRESVVALLPLLAFGRMCGAINQYYLQASFQLAEKPLLQVAHDSLILAVNMALLFPLTLMFGLRGTAAAVLLAEALGIVIGIALSRRAFKLPFNFWGTARVFAATGVMAVTTFALKVAPSDHALLQLFGVVLISGLAYAAAALIFDVARFRSSIITFLRSQPRDAQLLPWPHNLSQPHEAP